MTIHKLRLFINGVIFIPQQEEMQKATVSNYGTLILPVVIWLYQPKLATYDLQLNIKGLESQEWKLDKR